VNVIAEAIVDWGALGKVVAASLIAGIGATFCFSVAIAGATRAAELRRDNRGGVATFYALLGAAGFAATVGAIVIGIVVMTNKG
jgi:hypothetical protein